MPAFFLLLVVLALSSPFLIFPATAQTSGTQAGSQDFVPAGEGEGDVTGCATDTWASIVNQSVLQARREMLVNQRLITKPDSVLAYGCFNLYLKKTKESDYIFSGTDRWANVSVPLMNGDTATINVSMGSDSLDYALYTVVFLAHRKYLEANFNHSYLGGTSTDTGTNTAVVNNPDDTSCDIMAKIWQQAKCKNLEDAEIFYTFEDLVDFDPRTFPDNMACNDSGITQEMIAKARNTDHKFVEFSKIKTHLDYMKAPEGNSGSCMSPIPTGVTIVRGWAPAGQKLGDLVQYPDAVCSNAGCTYQVKLPSGEGKCLPESQKQDAENLSDSTNTGS